MPAYTKDAAIEKIREITERVGASDGIEVVEVELLGGGRHRILRIFIDKPTGVTHGDCEMISQNVGTILDVEDIVPADSYTLEVSSPGVERKLSKPRDFERFVGQKIKVVLREPVENQRRWEGALTAFKGNKVTLDVAPGRAVEFDLGQVEKANLKFEW